MLMKLLIAFILAEVFSVSSELQTKRRKKERKYARKIIYRNSPRKKNVPVNILWTKGSR